MSKLSQTLVRVAAALSLALPLVAVAATPAAAAEPVTLFNASHSRDCDYAFTEGWIAWNTNSPGAAGQVDVIGRLVDLPVVCVPPGPRVGSPFAEFYAYANGQLVDSEVIHTTGGYNFSLSNSPSVTLIDPEDIRVCRDFGPMLPAFTCGDTQTYRRPPAIGPAQ